MKEIVFAGILLVACGGGGDRPPSFEEQTRQLIPASDAGVDTRHCVTEVIKQTNEDTFASATIGKISFCTDGKTLALCTSDSGCITVSLPAERP